MLLTLLTLLYVVCVLLLTFYASSEVLLLFIYWRHRHDHNPTPRIDHWPSVAVQLPIYNERYVVPRLLEAAARLDYPRDRLAIQVLDDSTDETSLIVAELVTGLQRQGLNIQHVRREQRQGFKAGALAYGLEQLDCEFTAVLDADFVPPPDFLRRTIPFLVSDPRLGMVQTRWGHLNADANLLTASQVLAVDGHFVVEQVARCRAGWLLSFNGSGGVWRVQCIRDAGGWRDQTLTEDLDLSYRAQLAGWRFLYLPEVVVPAELPPQLAAYKQQQARWAKGNTQCLVHLALPLWRARFSFMQRLMATLHLCQYLPHPLMLLLLLLTPPLLLSGSLRGLPLGPLGLAGIGPPLIYVVSQRRLYPDWKRRLLAFPALLLFGTGIAWSNTRAVLSALLKERDEFRRTPKFIGGWQASSYALRSDPAAWVEGFLALYALWGVWLALRYYPPLAIYLAIYGLSFGMVALWSLYDLWELRRVRRAAVSRVAQRERS